MTQHYYSKKPVVESRSRQVDEVLRGTRFVLETDAGVFSKQGVDFGSKLLIESMEIGRFDRVLDVGCGYGPIGLSAAHLAKEGFATLLDINERAVELATRNAKRNGLTNVRILQSDLLEQVKEEVFDCVLTNPPIRAGKETVHRIFEEAFQVLGPNGKLWVVIQKKQGSPSAFTKLEMLFPKVKEVTKDRGYRIFCATK